MAKKTLVQGILPMERVRQIIRLFEQGFSQRAIHRSTGIARSTIQEYLRMVELHRLTFESAASMSDAELRKILRKKVPGRKRCKNVQADFSRVHTQLHSRKGVTLELLWKEWCEETGGGYSYSTFCRRYREYRKKHTVTMRQQYRPGERLLTDYCGETLSWYDSKGRAHRLEVFVAVLGASNKIFAEVTESQKSIHWTNSHRRALEYFGGVPEAIYIDNLKSGVTKSHRYEPEINRVFEEFATHYRTAIFPVRARKPRDKAKVEQAVQQVERDLLAPLRNRVFHSVQEVNAALRPLLEKLNSRKMKDYGLSRDELFEKIERRVLVPLPVRSFQPALWKKTKISLDYHIQLERHYYSVPYYHVGKEVWVKVTEKLIEIFYENKRIASHARSTTPFRHTTTEAHMPSNHKAVKSWTFDNFVKWAQTVGPHTEKLIYRIAALRPYREQSYRSILGIQRLEKKYGSSLLERAAEYACYKKHYSQRALHQILEAFSETKEENKPLTHENVRGATYYH